MKNRILYKADETVAIIIPAPKSKRENETENEWLERVFTKASKNITYIEFEDVEESALPSREHRNAWRGNKQNGLKVDSFEKSKIDDAKAIKILINKKKNSLAIEELKKEGKLDNNGRLKKNK